MLTPLASLFHSVVIAVCDDVMMFCYGHSDMAGSSYTQGSSGTLPRSKKGKKERYVSVAESSKSVPTLALYTVVFFSSLKESCSCFLTVRVLT